MLRTTSFLLALALTISCGTSRQPHPTQTPRAESVRGEAGRRMDAYLDAAQSFGFTGTVLVADRDGIVLRRGYGAADASRRVTPEMLFDMGSMVKQFTAAAILLLESEGKLSVNDSIGRFFPDAPADKAGIPLRQVLTHSAGLVGNVAGDYDQISRDSLVRAVLFTPLVSPPGKEFNYSNAGFSLLAVIIEQITGMPYEGYMRERIFHPAGMTHTGYSIAGLDSSLVAHSFTPPVDHGTPAERLARAGGPGWNLRGNGGILTNVDDIYAYERALLRGVPISPATQTKQFSVQFRRSPTLAHGFDWWIEPAEDGGIQFNRGGDGPQTGVVAEYRRYPRDTSAFILLANNRHHGWSTRRYVMPRLRRLYTGEDTLHAPVVHAASASALDQVVGVYAIDSASSFRIERIGDHLALSAVGQRAADVMIFNRDTTSMRNRVRINQRATNLLEALARGDSAAARPSFESDARLSSVLADWRKAQLRYGPAQCVQVLGNDRLDRGVFMTTARVRLRDRMVPVRWTWSGATAVINSEDGMLPATLGIGADAPVDAAAWSPYWWLSGRDSAITYDLLNDQSLSMQLGRDSGGRVQEISFDLPRGKVVARRTASEAAPVCEPMG